MPEPIGLSAIQYRFVETNGIRLHIAEQGTGPLVVLLHGWPESWYSWRHQIGALAAAGYHVVAPDQRGYGQASRPEAIDQYSLFHLTGDVIGLIDALGELTAVVVGHDWGAPVAWHTALFRPDRVRGVGGLSVLYQPRGAMRPLEAMRQFVGEDFYWLYFRQPGVAEAEFERDVRDSLLRTLYALSGEAPEEVRLNAGRTTGGWLAKKPAPETLPAWLSEADLDFYTAEFERSGFRGSLNWYRNIDRNWELTAPWAGARILPPALFVAGDADPVLAFPGARRQLSKLNETVPNLRQSVMLPGCGHWTQQERPAEVNRLLIDFLGGL